jgi:predicted phosphodiesterase
MQRIVKDLPKSFEIIAGSCTHIGSIMCHREGIEKAVDYVASTPNCFFIHTGDWIEAICTDDKRYNAPPDDLKDKEQSIPMKQAMDAVNIFRPIKDKIIVGLIGNHERKLSKVGNLVEDIICNKDFGLNIPYGTEACRIILENNGKPLFSIFAMHGRKIFNSNAKDFEQREANMKAALKLYLQEQQGDCSIMLCGHGHKIIIVNPSPRLILMDGENGQRQRYLQGVTGTGYIPPDQRWYAMCGSARKSRQDGYDDYAQCFPAADLGFVRIVVDNGEIEGLYPFPI